MPEVGADRMEALRRASRITVLGAAVDAVLGAVKIAVGVFAHSHALVADGIHSLTDLVTDAGVLVVARSARADPDEHHPYGHGRFETLATLVLGALLLLVAGALAQDSALRLAQPVTEAPGVVALGAALMSIIAKEWVFRATRRVAEEIGSRLLLANAWHSRSDALSSIAVLAGILGALAGWVWADLVAALVVAAMIAWVGWGLIASAARELVDTGLPEERLASIRATAAAVPGVEGIHRLRSRLMGPEALLDVDVEVSPLLSVAQGHRIATEVSTALIDRFDEIVDVTVHVDPVRTHRDVGSSAASVEAAGDGKEAGANEAKGARDERDATRAGPIATNAGTSTVERARSGRQTPAEHALLTHLASIADLSPERVAITKDATGAVVDLFVDAPLPADMSSAHLAQALRSAGLSYIREVRLWRPADRPDP